MSDLWSILWILAIGGTVATMLRPKAGFLFPLIGVIGWAAVFTQWISSPPLGVTAGDATHVIVLMAPIAGFCACVLYPFYIQRKLVRQASDPFDPASRVEYTEQSWHLPKWMGGKSPEEAREERSRRSPQARTEEYRMRMRSAFRGRGEPSGRRRSR